MFMLQRFGVKNSPFNQFNQVPSYRKLLSNTDFLKQKQWILGAYAAYGQSYSGHGGFEQESFGIEALSEIYDFRANFYLAKDKSRYVNGGTTYQTDADQNYWQTTYHKHQVAMTGVDFELGYKLPISKIDTKIFIGDYFYQRPKSYHASSAIYNSILAKDNYDSINGQKARLELKFDHHNIKLFDKNANLTLATEYKYDHVNQGQLFAIVKLSYQFGKDASVLTTNTKSNTNNNQQQPTDLHSRMNEFVVKSHVMTNESDEMVRDKLDGDDLGADDAVTPLI